MEPINLSNNVNIFIQDALQFDTTQKYTMIYFDPPFNSKRNYTLNVDSDIGFVSYMRTSTPKGILNVNYVLKAQRKIDLDYRLNSMKRVGNQHP